MLSDDEFDEQILGQMHLLCSAQRRMINSLRRLVALQEQQIHEFPATACELQDRVTALEVRLAQAPLPPTEGK